MGLFGKSKKEKKDSPFKTLPAEKKDSPIYNPEDLKKHKIMEEEIWSKFNEKSEKAVAVLPTLEERRAMQKESREKIGNTIKQIKRKLNKNGNLERLNAFVKKYNVIPFHEFQTKGHSKIEKLRQLFGKYDVWIPIADLELLLQYEFQEYSKTSILKKLEFVNANTVEEYTKIFMELCGEQYGTKQWILEEFLEKKHIGFSNLQEVFNKILKEKDLDDFENNLFDDSPVFSMDDIDDMTGTDFENFLVRLFIKMGYNAKRIGKAGDQGGDLILTKFGKKTIVQAKRSSDPITNKAIQEVVGAISHYDGDSGMVVTNNIW